MANFPIGTYMAWYADQIEAVTSGQKRFPWREWEELANSPRSKESKARAEAERSLTEGKEEKAVRMMAESAASAILKDATIEASIQVRRKLAQFSDELKRLQDIVDRTNLARAQDADFLQASVAKWAR